MKHSMPSELQVELAKGLDTLDVVISADSVLACLDYLQRVLRANKALNLTRIVDPRDAVRLHLLDSLAVMPEVEAAPRGRMLDIGTGAGFPGVPLAISTGRDTVLLDSVAKKATAVRELVLESGLSRVIVVSERAEDYAKREAAGFGIVLARAVAPLPSLVELGAPFLGDGGRLVLLKGRPSEEEIKAGDRVARIVGAERLGTRAFSIPGSGEHRTILTYERVRESSVVLPRRVGLAQRRPLA